MEVETASHNISTGKFSTSKKSFSLFDTHAYESFGVLLKLVENEIVSHNICTTKFSISKTFL